MSPTSECQCPRCHVPMHAVRAEDATLHGCATCRGVWMDNQACQKLMAGSLSEGAQQLVANVDAGAANSVAQRRDGADPSRKLQCPVCSAPLSFVRTPFSGVCVDVCAQHGTWFDPHEIRVIAQAIAIKAASDDAFVEGEMSQLRDADREALMNHAPLGRLLNLLR